MGTPGLEGAKGVARTRCWQAHRRVSPRRLKRTGLPKINVVVVVVVVVVAVVVVVG